VKRRTKQSPRNAPGQVPDAITIRALSLGPEEVALMSDVSWHRGLLRMGALLFWDAVRYGRLLLLL
jgi:hypothetical protein